MENTRPPIDEYKDLSENMRHYGNMRFAQLTIFIAITGGLLAVIFGNKNPSPNHIIIPLIGISIAIMFWIMEERAADYWQTFKKRAVVLEIKLGFQQYSIRPKARFWDKLTATNASRAIYGLSILFWIHYFILLFFILHNCA